MNDETKSQPLETEDNGRTATGKFAVGNKFAKGNPFSKKRAEFRSFVQNRITTDDLSSVLDSLISQANNGDLNAIKLLLEYSIGKPDADLKENEINLKERQYNMWFESQFWQLVRKNGMAHPEYPPIKKIQEQIALEVYRLQLQGEKPDIELITKFVCDAILEDVDQN